MLLVLDRLGYIGQKLSGCLLLRRAASCRLFTASQELMGARSLRRAAAGMYLHDLEPFSTQQMGAVAFLIL